MTTYSDPSGVPATTGSRAFSVPSIVAILAAIATFFVGGGLGILLAIVAFVAGVVGAIMALSPNVRGGMLSIIAIFLSAIGAIVAVFKIIAWVINGFSTAATGQPVTTTY